MQITWNYFTHWQKRWVKWPQVTMAWIICILIWVLFHYLTTCLIMTSSSLSNPQDFFCVYIPLQFGRSGQQHWSQDASQFLNSLQWHYDECDGISNHRPHDFLLNRLFWSRSENTPKLCVTGLGAGNSPVIGEFPTQRASNLENVSIWWCHHVTCII